ncbi:MAG: LptF/LptG family permease [bacterium]|nr:LptF/LptG family permease [bacterium]
MSVHEKCSPAVAGRLWVPRAPWYDGLVKFWRMRVINYYLFRAVLTTFVMSLLVVTFMMLMGSLVQIIALIFKNVSVSLIVQLLAISLPSVICYALPFSMAAATLLVYSRLSADGEITAMKATGISVYRIATPAIVLSVVVALMAVPAANNLLPWAHFKRSNVLASYTQADASALIETGVWTPIGRYRFFANYKEGDMFRQILISEDLEGGRSRLINAERGYVRTIRHENRIKFEFYDVRTEERNPERSNSFLRMSADRVDMFVDMGRIVRQGKRVLSHAVKPGHMLTSELREKIAERERKLAEILRTRRLTMAQLEEELARGKRRWRELQKQPAWRRVLKERGRIAKHAFEDILGRNMYAEYEAQLKKYAGEGGSAVKLLREWYTHWPQDAHSSLEYRSMCQAEINYRYSYAFAAIAFAIIGIPLGIRAHRSEKTIGFLICLALIAVHYAMVISIMAFSEKYVMRPDLLVWIPDLLFLVTGVLLLWRNHRIG